METPHLLGCPEVHDFAHRALECTIPTLIYEISDASGIPDGSGISEVPGITDAFGIS